MTDTTRDKTTDKIEEHTRQRIAAFLPLAIVRTLESYQSFSCQDAPDEAKEFNAHHTACKVAIAHIELLIKLARWADLPGAEEDTHATQQESLARMMQEAESRLREFRKTASDTDPETGSAFE